MDDRANVEATDEVGDKLFVAAIPFVPAFAQAPIVIKFSHVVAQGTPKGKGAEYFKKIAEERTKGRVKVEVYANSTLYKDNEEVDALQLGAVQMLAPSLAKFGPLGVREFEVFDLPYLFDNYDELHKVTRGPVGASLLKKFEPTSNQRVLPPRNNRGGLRGTDEGVTHAPPPL